MSAASVPSKCPEPSGAGITPNSCATPGSLLRCQICPESPTYWRKTANSPGASGGTAGKPNQA